MPPLASFELDTAAIALLTQWILSSELRMRASYADWSAFFFAGTPGPEGEPGADADRDGATNQQEFLAGTDPRNAADRLSGGIEWDSGHAFLRVGQPANRRLEVEFNDDPQQSGPWSPFLVW